MSAAATTVFDRRAIGILDEGIKPFMYETFSTWSETIYGSPLPQLPRR